MSQVQLRPQTELSELRNHIDDLSQASWLGSARKWWPYHLFHCTDILNVVNILKSGELLSRTQAKQSSSLIVDIAAPSIIDNTNPDWQEYVRLYFRPRTPTQYNNEGFRPIEQRSYGAHCPVPVYLLFEAATVLARRDCLFTDGNLAAGAQPKRTINELRQMPFQLIYHDSWFDPVYRSTIVYHRNAEVLIPQRLDLRAVRSVFCRSQAEYETLLNLLPLSTRNRWADKIGVAPQLHLFNSRWSFVQQVELTDQRLLFRFNQNTKTPGPFVASVEIHEWLRVGSQRYIWNNSQFQADSVLELTLSNLSNPYDYSVRLHLDDQLAFQGRHQDYHLPF